MGQVNSSKEMGVLIGRIREEDGKAFTNEVGKWFNENTDWQKIPLILKNVGRV